MNEPIDRNYPVIKLLHEKDECLLLSSDSFAPVLADVLCRPTDGFVEFEEFRVFCVLRIASDGDAHRTRQQCQVICFVAIFQNCERLQLDPWVGQPIQTFARIAPSRLPLFTFLTLSRCVFYDVYLM